MSVDGWVGEFLNVSYFGKTLWEGEHRSRDQAKPSTFLLEDINFDEGIAEVFDYKKNG